MAAFSLERATTGKRISWVSVLGLILVPLIIAGVFVVTAGGVSDRLGQVHAAVVNTDEPVDIDGQPTALGRQLAAELVDDDRDQNVTWEVADEDSAADGLATGDYAAVVTIPEGFSQAVTSFNNEDPLAARQATIEVETSESSPLTDPMISQAIAAAETSAFNRDMTTTYLDNVYVGFNEQRQQMREVAGSATELSDGASQLDSGVSEAAAGSDELAQNMGQLGSAGTDLTDGAAQVADGVGEFSTGASDLAGGAGQLSDGLAQIRQQTADLPEQTQQLADGATELSAGVDEYTRGVDGAIEPLAAVVESISESDIDAEAIQEGVDELDAVTDDIDQVASGAADGLRQFRDRLEAGPSDDEIEAACRDAGYEPGSEECTALAEGMSAATSNAASGLDEPVTSDGDSVIDATDRVATGTGELSSTVDDLASSLPDEFAAVMDDLTEVSAQVDQLTQAGTQLRGGSSDLAEGTQQLAEGTGQLTEGIGQSADGAAELSEGAAQLSTGASELTDGADELSTGLSQYVTGVDAASTGARDLSTGLDQLTEGSGQVADGSNQLADGLDEGAEQVPSYTSAERDNLADVVSQPVSQDEPSSATVSDASAVGLLVVLSLWLGGLATYLLVRAVSARALPSRVSSAALVLRGLAPGALVALVHAVALGLLAQVILDLALVDLVSLMALLCFAGVVFAVLNYALVAWFGGIGRFVSVVVVVLSAGAHVISALPAFFDTITPVLPLTPALDGAMAIATGGPGVGAAYGALLSWLIVGAAACLVAVVRKRSADEAVLARLAQA